ncbi:MAG: hypothetical protein II008_16150 [Oscillospiraceae bacterium]|nr:hypothetical protein [Oscillospiraceae bacterium]
MMDCSSCAWRSDCDIRKAPGLHRMECDEYFPDLSPSKSRKPRRIRTPEDRQPPIETREE